MNSRIAAAMLCGLVGCPHKVTMDLFEEVVRFV